MRMDPHPPELCGLPPGGHLFVKKLRHGHIVEGDGHSRRFLTHEDHVLDPQPVMRPADPEAPDLRRSRIPQKLQLGPRRRTEA